MKSNRRVFGNKTDRVKARVEQTLQRPFLNTHGQTRKEIHKNLSGIRKEPNQGPLRKEVSRSPKSRVRPARLAKEAAPVKNPKLLLDVPNVGLKHHIEYVTPTWFRYPEKADVSVIVPLYKSSTVILDLIDSWTKDHGGLKVELVFVDDNCPQSSKDAVIKHWTKKDDKSTPIGRIYYNTQNLGYGGACNTGAFNATGDYLIFLNADTTLSPNWIKPIVKALEDKTIGVVGNLQIKEGGMWNNTIDSAGSEWNWDHKSFLHIGRHSYHSQTLPIPYTLENAPRDILEFGERDMVTGCCFGIRKELFTRVGGFNPNYRIGYWEDSELCMTVKEMGFRVVYEPASVIYHKLGHTNSGAHKFAEFNREYFANKWIKSGRLDALIHNPRTKIPQIGTIAIKRRGANGDVLAAASVCPALKKKYPGCKIIFTTECPEVLQGNPYIDKIIPEEQLSERLFQVFYNLDLVYEYRPYTPIIEAYADAVGVKVEDCKNHLIHKDFQVDPGIVIHAGKTNWVGRDWPLENFAAIAQKFIDEGEKVTCIGRGGDGLVPGNDMRGKTSIPEMAGIIKNAKLFIGIDSLPMHIAQTFDVPGICFFGCIDPALRIYSDNMSGIKAANLACLGCHHRKPPPTTVTAQCETGTLDCIKKVGVEQMWSAINGLLNKN